MIRLLCVLAFCGLFFSCAHSPKSQAIKDGAANQPLERHFKNLKQLTFEGTNAEAYFAPDGSKLIFQGHGPGHEGNQECDQIYTMNLDGSQKTLVSIRGGRNTCSFFTGVDRVIFSSTQAAGGACPKERDKSKGYVWEIFKSYDVYSAKPDGSDVKALTTAPGYDAESTVCGNKIVFTSARKGDSLQVYTMDLNGRHVKQLTRDVGYNGGPFYSPDCSRIVYRAYIPTDPAEVKKFKAAVQEGYIPQGPLEIFVMNANGSDRTQLTRYQAASFAPSFFHDGQRIIFSTNTTAAGKIGHAFQLWAIDSKHPEKAEQLTSVGTFNGFPMFSPDGKYLVFASNRNSVNPHQLQIFLAEWQD